MNSQVLAVKEKVRETKGDAYPAANQVLIFQGKVGQVTMVVLFHGMQLMQVRTELGGCIRC